jgi:CHRD domain
MRRLPIIFILAILSLTTSVVFGQTLGAVLTASQETPPTTTPGFGNATVTFDANRQNVTVTITVSNLGSPINNFHIHKGAAGVAGPVVLNLIGLGGTFVNGTMTGTFPVDPTTAQEMVQNPANFYVNVHTTAFPNGAIRGQLAFASGGPVTYAAELRGANEVPATGSSAFGSAFVTIDTINNNLQWEVNTSGIVSPTLSHIHRGAAGISGPVLINFATSAAQIPNGRTNGTIDISPLDISDRTALASAATANGYYVNVHSAAFPTGEIRGQLVAANEYDVAVAGRVTNGQGQTFVTDVRIFNPSYTTSAVALVEYLTGGATATASLVVNLAPRGTAVLDDIGGPAGLNVVGTIGALRISSASQLAATSRIYADLRSTGKGTLGQFVPALSRASGLRRGVLPQLTNHADLTSGSRTNIGFFNPNTSGVTARLELRDNAGTLVATNTISLPALAQQQNGIGVYFPGVDLSNAANLTMSFDSSAPIFAYGAVNDNVSADSSYVAAISDIGVAAN